MATLALAAGACLVGWMLKMCRSVEIADIAFQDRHLTDIDVLASRLRQALEATGRFSPDKPILLEQRIEAILRSEKTLLTLARDRPNCGVLRDLVRRGPYRALMLGSRKGNLRLVKLAAAILKRSGLIPPRDLSNALKAAAGPDKAAIENFLREELRELGCNEDGARMEMPKERQAAGSDDKPKLPPPDKHSEIGR